MKSKTKRILNWASLALSVVAVLVLTSCDKNDDPAPVENMPNDSGKNFVKVNDESIAVSYGYMFDFGGSSQFTSRNFVIDLANGHFDGYSYAKEMTSWISIDLNSALQDEISEGTYTLLLEKDVYDLPLRTPMTFVHVYMRTHSTYVDGNFTGGNVYNNVISGSIKVKKAGDSYELDFDLIFEGNIQIKGHYEGELKYYYEG